MNATTTPRGTLPPNVSQQAWTQRMWDTSVAQRPGVARYGIALVATAAALGITAVLAPQSGGAVFPAFFAAVVISAITGGTGPGVMSALLAGLGVTLLFPVTERDGAAPELVRLTTFAIATAVILVTMRAMRHAQRRAEVGERDARHLAYQLQEQAVELEHQIDQSQSLTQELEMSTQELLEAGEEARRARDAAETAEQRYRALVDGLVVGVILMEQDDARIIASNAAAERILGLTSDQMAGRSSLDPRWRTIHEDHSPFPGETHPVVLSLREGIPQSNIIMGVHRPDDTLAWIEVNSRPLRRPGESKPYAAVASFVDITARKLAEDELRRSEEQLRHSQKLEAVGQLAGGIAHDFNNLLTAIKSYSEFLLEDLDAEDARRKDVIEIQTAAERAATLTRQLLAFSRKQILEPQSLDLNSVVHDMENMLRRLIGADIDIRIVRAPDLGRVEADPSQIAQVIMNLAVNARDAMPSGGTLTIETANVDLDEHYADAHAAVDPGSYVVLTVTDDGAGIERHVLPRIFEPFFTTKERGKGTGLGLSTVYGIVKQSGGYVWVYSDVGQGTTFRIYLPRVEARSEPRPVMPNGDALATGTETVLVAEDEDAVRAVVTRVLAHRGYSVLEARNGREALNLCRRHEGPIHLILSDVIMPEVNGSELVRSSEVLRPEARILLMSGYTDGELERRGVVNPRVAFLQKPFTPTALAKRVREVLDQPGAVG